MWYSNIYRRHLCDMHIDDWDENFLSKFSPETYAAYLKIAKVQNAIIYLQSHVGLCYFPTKNGHIHKAFAGNQDMMKRLIDLCHADNIKVTGYYSLNYNTREHDVHEDWRMITVKGKSQRDGGSADFQKLDFASVKGSRYGLCCPNNQGYREFVYEQIDEMTNYFTCEGYFFDMPFWPHTCYCESCKKRWLEEVGGDIPVNPAKATDEHYKLIEKKMEWMGEWTQSVTNYVKSINPELSVEHNFAQGIAGDANAGCAESVNDACDFVGGDLYGGVINHSLACKFYKNITKNQPFDYMFSRCKPALAMHTLTKSPDEMKIELMLTAAHHGATMVIDAIDPIGTLDKRVYERIGEAFGYQEKYEPYFKGDMIEDIGLYYSMKSRIDVHGEGYDSKTACITASKTMITHHVPFGVTGPYYTLDQYKALIMPLVTKIEEEDNKRIISYVENGGKLYISGAENPKLIEKLFGSRIKGRTEEINIYIAPEKKYEQLFKNFNIKYPLPFTGTAPVIEPDTGCEIMAKFIMPYTKPSQNRFASIHSNPPGFPTEIPAVITKKFGKGEVIWSAVNIEGIDICEYREIFMNILGKLIDLDALSVKSTAPDDVEITVFEDSGEIMVNVVLIAEKTVAPKVYPFEVSIKMDNLPKRVVLLPENKGIDFKYENGYVIFNTKELDIFDMYCIEK